MVGTSLFENYMEKCNDQNFRNYFTDLKDKNTKEYDNEKDRIERIKNKIDEWLKRSVDKTNACAEIKSLAKLRKELKEDLEIYFLSSDTIPSKLAMEIIEQRWSDFNELKDCKFHTDVINDLQIKDRSKFNSGMVNLINKVYKIANEYWQDVIINITAGYKATLPYLTILAQVNKCPIYYIFEDTDALIKIPYIPLDINWRIFKDNKKLFMEMEKEEIKEIPPGVYYREEIESLIERADNLISLNPLGVALWEKYKERFDIFYISDEVNSSLDEQKKICEKSFLELKKRLKENPSDRDLNHGLRDVDLGEFRCFKHKEENLQVRILYTTKEWTTRYGTSEIDIYIGSIAMGTEVHNAGSNAEYVEKFKRLLEREEIKNLDNYEIYRIEK